MGADGLAGSGDHQPGGNMNAGGSDKDSAGGSSASTGKGGQASAGSSVGGRTPGGTAGAGGASSGGAGGGGRAGGNGDGGDGRGGRAGLGGSGTSGPAGGAAGGESDAGGASDSGGATSAYHPCPTDGSSCKIMPFGDSITDGYNPDTPGGYRVELFHRAHADGKKITFVGSGANGPDTVDGVPFPHNHEGHSGWTIDPEGSRSGISTLLKNSGGSQSVMTTYAPHVVLLMIGTNDAIDNYAMSGASARLESLIDTIYNQLPDVLIVVAQPIPSRGDTSKGDDGALSDRLKKYGEAIPAVVKARADRGKHILSVDLFTPFSPNKSRLLEDQYHPNHDGYLLLGDSWYSVLQPLL